MATTDGDEGVCGGRYKRCLEAGDCKDDYIKDGTAKRCLVNGDDVEANGGIRDFNINFDKTGGGGSGEGLIYYYSDVEEETEDATLMVEHHEERYVLLTEDAVRERQDKDTAEVVDVLSLPPGFAAALLRYYKWGKTRLKEEWFSDDRRIRDVVGLPADGVPVAVELSRERLVCAICFESFPAGGTRAAACTSHFYCDECWQRYIGAAVDDGPRCLSLRCPDPSCSAAVVQELVDIVAVAKDKARYAQFALRSYVDESGGRIKWCPGSGCCRAIEFLGCIGDNTSDVFCDCGYGFCWRCGEEAHRPFLCATVRAWLLKNSSESASVKWVLANTKLCPKCHRPIEKNQGCNNMTCKAPCGHRFCWICLEPLGAGHITCNRYRPRLDRIIAGRVVSWEQQRQWQAKASLDRYVYYYKRWAANYESLQVVFKDMATLESEIEKMADGVQASAMDLRFLTKAYRQIAECRRVLRWAYAYGHFLNPVRDAAKHSLFDHLMNDANRSLERLHGCAEGERKQLCAAAKGTADIVERYRSYKKKLENLTVVTQQYFDNLVKAFETDLAEVKPAI